MEVLLQRGRERLGEGYEDWGLKIFPSPESEKPR
jgi:hypothetical protein